MSRVARVAVAALASSIVNANITTLAGLARGSNWNQAWGTVGYAQITANFGGFVATTLTITGLEVTFTAIAGRRYRTTISTEVNSSVAGDITTLTICDAANTQLQRATTPIIAANVAQALEKGFVETGLSGSTTRRVRAVRSAGTGTCDVVAGTDRPAFILVDDIGPS